MVDIYDIIIKADFLIISTYITLISNQASILSAATCPPNLAFLNIVDIFSSRNVTLDTVLLHSTQHWCIRPPSLSRKTLRRLLSYRENRRVLQSRSDLLTINVGIVIANARVLLCISPTGTRELASYVIYVLSTRAEIEFRVNSLPKFHRISFDVFAEYLVQSHIGIHNGQERLFGFEIVRMSASRIQ